MNTLRKIVNFVLALLLSWNCLPAFMAPPAIKDRPPVSQATVVFDNLWRMVARKCAVALINVQFAIDRFLGQPTFLFGVGLTMDEKIEKGLNDIAEKLNKVAELEKRGDLTAKQLEAATKSLEELSLKMQEFARQRLLADGAVARNRAPGTVSDECAKHLASHFILHCERSGKMESLASNEDQRNKLLNVAKGYLGISGKTALTTSDIPLPVQYGSEIRELISEFGVARKKMMKYPIGMGTARPPRMGTRPAFGSIAMSGSITEKSPTITFASLESHKIGGLVRLPREIDEQSIVPMGQFLAFYGAVEFSRAEDTWAFLADGSGTYESVVGITKHCTDNSKTITLGAATGPDDATIAHFRAMRTKVNKAALSGKLSAYYLDTTWEVQLRTFNTEADPNIFVTKPDGSCTLDGYPIIWTDVLEPFGTDAVTSKYLAVFGALQFWWMGEHGSPRIDTSEHVFFANDQLAVRFIEEIDFDYCAIDAVSALRTGAAS